MSRESIERRIANARERIEANQELLSTISLEEVKDVARRRLAKAEDDLAKAIAKLEAFDEQVEQALGEGELV